MTQTATRIRQDGMGPEAEGSSPRKRKLASVPTAEDFALVRELRQKNPDWRTEPVAPSVIQKAVDSRSGSSARCGATKAYRIQDLVLTLPEDLPEEPQKDSAAAQDSQKPEDGPEQKPEAGDVPEGPETPEAPEVQELPEGPKPSGPLPSAPPPATRRKTEAPEAARPEPFRKPAPAPVQKTAVPEAPRAAQKQKPRRKVRTWPVLLLTLPAFVAIWSGWVGLGEMAGFGIVHPLPGIVDSFKLNTAITLPIGVETYAAFALRVWLSGAVTGRAMKFAKRSAIGSLLLGAGGQVVYHLLAAPTDSGTPWPIVTAVACLPVLVLGMGAALADLLKAQNHTDEETSR